MRLNKKPYILPAWIAVVIHSILFCFFYVGISKKKKAELKVERAVPLTVVLRPVALEKPTIIPESNRLKTMLSRLQRPKVVHPTQLQPVIVHELPVVVSSSYLTLPNKSPQLIPGKSEFQRWRQQGQLPPANESSPSDGQSSLQVNLASQSRLSVFAKYMAERLNIPEPLSLVYPKGNSSVMVCHKAGDFSSWNISKVHGIPYFNAVVFETTEGCLHNQDIATTLHQLEDNCFNIDLNFTRNSSFSEKRPELSYSIFDGNIHYKIKHFYVSKEWRLFTDTGGYLVDQIKPPTVGNPFEYDPTLKHLRLSRAFVDNKVF